jgi:arylsulfatase A-like enzyme
MRVFFTYLILMVTGLSAAAADKPNVLFLFTDDQRHDTVRALGNDQIETPHTDSLVASGTTFTNAYIMGASSPAVCVTSRASLMSGQTLWNCENQGIWSYNVSEKYKSLPQVFRENGYTSFGTGKQHNGTDSYQRSFSTGAKILFGGMTKSQYVLPLYNYSPHGRYNKKRMHTGTHSAEVYADATIKFLEEQKDSDTPFFAYVSFQTPHDPRQSPPEFRARYKDDQIRLPKSFQTVHPFDNGMLKIRDEGLARTPREPTQIKTQIADYYSMITHTDAQVGRILEALKKAGKFDNTLIVFSSDNGLSMGRHGLLGKQSVYDHAVHVPLLISGPGIPKNETREQLCYIFDIYPTLVERAGLAVPETVQFTTLNPIIKDADAKGRAHLYFAYMNWQRAMQDSRYKLIEYCVKGKRNTQLFDLQQDPQEMNNLAGNPEFAGKLAELRKLLAAERVRLNDGKSTSGFATKQGEEFWKTYEGVAESATPALKAYQP